MRRTGTDRTGRIGLARIAFVVTSIVFAIPMVLSLPLRSSLERYFKVEQLRSEVSRNRALTYSELVSKFGQADYSYRESGQNHVAYVGGLGVGSPDVLLLSFDAAGRLRKVDRIKAGRPL